MMNSGAFHAPRRDTVRLPLTGRILRIGCSLALLCFFVFFETEGVAGHLRKLCTLETYWTHDGEGPYGTWTEVYKSSSIDYYERAMQAVYIPPPENSIAFVISMLECPDLDHHGVKEDAPPNEMFYDAVSMLKYLICIECMNMTIGGVTYNTTITALIPGDAAECIGPNGEPFDRIKVLEELKIGVKILGSPIQKDELASEYLRDNVDNDVGIKDLNKLRVFNMTEHPVVVLVDYTTAVMQPIDDVLDTFINSAAPAAYSMDYTPEGLTPNSTNSGINTGFLMVKPDQQEMTNIMNEYKTTEYDPSTGWAGSGVGGFPGAMGTSGILTHYYKTKTPNSMVLDKCKFNNDFEFHLDAQGACRDGSSNTCGACRDTPKEDVVVARLNDKVCGKPFNCPDNSALTGTLCDEFHKKWFTDRVEYEETYLKGNSNKAKREGTFKTERTLGYCSEEGSIGYEKIIPDAESGPLPIPEPEPPTASCPSTCQTNKYLKPDCTCTTDECEACPEGTRCQRKGNGLPPLCIDCECGFCDYDKEPCCNFNGVNNCKSATNSKECLLQNAYFPGWPGAGNACSGVEISATAVPNGCGCQPNESTPCTYDPTASTGDDKCFIVNARELLTSHPESSAVADACKACMDACDPCISGDGQAGVSEMMECLGKTIGKKREACRSSCSSLCIH